MTTTNNTILACVDGSLYTGSVCAHAAWASERLNAPIQVLHLQSPGTGQTDIPDLSGTLVLGGKSALLEKLTQVDEARGKLDLQKGKLILQYASDKLAEIGLDEESGSIETLHRRGSLVETISELETSAQLIVLGKRGENVDFATLHLGSNLERVARAAYKPVLVASRSFNTINRFVIAYDGGPSTRKAVDYVLSSPLFQGMECHLLMVASENAENRTRLEVAMTQLEQGGFVAHSYLQPGQADDVISEYVKSNEIDILIMGAYGHSLIRTLIIGSTTSNMLRSCPIPVLMFR